MVKSIAIADSMPLIARTLNFARHNGRSGRAPFAVPCADRHHGATSSSASNACVTSGALGEPVGLVRILTLRPRTFDTQPGISNPFRDLTYHYLISWPDRILELNAAGGYPLLLASHVVSQVLDGTRQRAMLNFVFRKCLEDPAHRWRWMAHAALIAWHRLNDQQLALKYDRAIADETDDRSLPSWTKQMYVSLLADLGEHEAARILLCGLLASRTVTDAHEQHVLLDRLKELESVENSSVSSKP